jgi:ketosteroid isomerase-like protein
MSTSNPLVADQSQRELAEKNRQLAERFFVILETYAFEELLEIFAPDGVKRMPYAPPGVGDTVTGAQAIYEQFSDMPRLFTAAKFPRRIYVTEDPNLVFVTCTGDLELTAGGKYENEYVFIFKLADGKITELSEFYNPILMARAFNVPL